MFYFDSLVLRFSPLTFYIVQSTLHFVMCSLVLVLLPQIVQENVIFLVDHKLCNVCSKHVSMYVCNVNVYTQQVANFSHHMCTDQSVSMYILHCSQALQHNYKMNCAIFYNFLLKKFWKENDIYFMHNILRSSVQYSTSVFSRAEGQHHA